MFRYRYFFYTVLFSRNSTKRKGEKIVVVVKLNYKKWIYVRILKKSCTLARIDLSIHNMAFTSKYQNVNVALNKDKDKK